MTLVCVVKNWDWPDLMRQTPDHRGIWDGIQFTVDPVDECDFLILLNNNMKVEVKVKCPRENVWALMQEPYVKGFNDWMVEEHEDFSRVYTHHAPSESPKYIASHPAIPWHINRSFDQLVRMDIPDKAKAGSWIVGNARELPGHLKRLSFLKFIQKNMSRDIDLYGRAVHYIDDKWDGLAPYRYSLAIENSNSPDYWTEKVADCYLTWTVPLYYGCSNLEKYFPRDSFIRIDINNPEVGLAQLKNIFEADVWKKRIPALTEARRLVLHEYQLFPHMSKLIKNHAVKKEEKEIIILPPYRRSKRTKLLRASYKIKRIFTKLHYRFK
jgi:hypothetical protein